MIHKVPRAFPQILYVKYYGTSRTKLIVKKECFAEWPPNGISYCVLNIAILNGPGPTVY